MAQAHSLWASVHSSGCAACGYVVGQSNSPHGEGVEWGGEEEEGETERQKQRGYEDGEMFFVPLDLLPIIAAPCSGWVSFCFGPKQEHPEVCLSHFPGT